MKTIFFKIIACALALYLSSCAKRNFFPDPDDPGLSLLTSHGFNIATAYINKVPYINPFDPGTLGIGGVNSAPSLELIGTGNSFDTLCLSWQFEINDNTSNNQPYPTISTISLLMPVPKSFTKTDFFALNGQRFSSNTNAVVLRSYHNYFDTLSGTSNIYFVSIKYDNTSGSITNLAFSGLFDANIGDSILITKGRFDFVIDTATLNF